MTASNTNDFFYCFKCGSVQVFISIYFNVAKFTDCAFFSVNSLLAIFLYVANF